MTRLTLAAFGRRADDVVTGTPHADELIAAAARAPGAPARAA